MNYGFVKVAAAVPAVHLANPKGNVQEIENLIVQAEGRGVEVIVFPELCLTGYSCGDLFGQQMLIDEAEQALIELLDFTRGLQITSIVGLPISWRGRLLNCAAIIQRGRVLALVPKTYLPGYKEFYEYRWFHSGAGIVNQQVMLCGSPAPLSVGTLVNTPSCTFGVELCEDLWSVTPPSNTLALRGADIIFNLSASNDLIGKRAYLEGLLSQQSARCLCGYVYASSGFGESTQDVVFGGKAMIYENGSCLAASPLHTLEPQLIVSEIDVERLRGERRVNTSFSTAADLAPKEPVIEVQTELFVPRDIELTRSVNPYPFVPRGKALDERCAEIFAIQTEGLARRLVHTRCKNVVIGISGGLDSTLALLVCAETFRRLNMDSRGIVAITMPGFGTTGRTHSNAMQLMQLLGCTIRQISIVPSVNQHFKDLGVDPQVHDVTYENCQARERTQILMDAANQVGGMVIGTGDLSELALGWATYNGDHMSMYGVNCSIPKTLVRHLVNWVATTSGEQLSRVLLDICDTPISPELIPADENGEIAQKTEDLVGPYPLHDFFLYNTLRHGFRPAKVLWLAEHAFSGEYDREVILHWLTTFYRRFFSQQFKRSCLPDGPKVGSCSLSPRGDWRMPSDAQSAAWIAECERMKQ